MAVDHLFASFILLLISNTGFSAEISMFVQTGASVQLDIQTQPLPEFENLYWTHDESENIVKYTSESKKVTLYKDSIITYFNTETFSLTLKNMQKTDRGLYTARTIGLFENNIVTYRVSVIDSVEAPVLTVNSSWSSDSCTVNFTCRSHGFTLSSTFVHDSCSQEEATSQNNTLILYCSEESIICNHSNPVGWKEDRINIAQLCEGNERQQIPLSYGTSYMIVLLVSCVVVGVIVFAGLILYCCCKNKTGVKQADDTDYDDVETLTQKMTGDTWTTITYHAAGRQTPSSAHDC